MSLAELAAVRSDSFDLVSVDLFDTLLLRDRSLQIERSQEISRSVSARLSREGYSIEPDTLTALRSSLHTLAYRAVSIERPEADATLAGLHARQARLLNLPDGLVPLLREAELAVERRRLRANQPLLRLLDRFRAAGKRIVATSDTFYSTKDLEWLLAETVEQPSPIMRIYSSADLQCTKHAGGLFVKVAECERIPTRRILHCGDNRQADIRMARASGCQAIHLTRSPAVRWSRKAGAAWFALTHAASLQAAG